MAKTKYQTNNNKTKRVSLYFDASTDESTIKWLKDNSKNINRAIVKVITMYANDELTSKEQSNKEIEILRSRADELKSILDKLINAQTKENHNVNTSILEIERVESAKTNHNSMRNIYNDVKATKEPIETETPINYETSVNNNLVGTNSSNQENKDNTSLGIDKYKGGRGFKKKGKGLADL